MFMYLNEVPEGRLRDDLALIIEEMLNQRIQGCLLYTSRCV